MLFLRATIVTGVLLSLAACGEAPPETGALPDVPTASARTDSPTPSPTPSAPPRIEFASATYDFGAMPETETRTGRFTFTNTGGRTLVIAEVSASCGCTVPRLAKREYEPGERGEILVEFEPSASGQQTKKLSIVSNSEPEEIARLTITADVAPFVDLEPKMLRVDDAVYGETNEYEVIARCADESFVIESVTLSNEHASARVEPPDAGPTRRIVVTVGPTAPWGGFFSWLEVTSRARPSPGAAPITHTRKLRVQGQVSGALTARPDTFRFGLKPGQSLHRVVKVWRPSGEPFTLDVVAFDATALDDLNVRLEQTAPAAYELILTARGSNRPEPSRGRVAFTTDVPGEERLEIPIVGVVRTTSRGVR